MKLFVSTVVIVLILCPGARAGDRLYPCGPGDPVVEEGIRCDPNLWLFGVHLTAKDGVSRPMILASWTDVSIAPGMRRTIYLQTVRSSRRPGAPAGSPAAIDVCIYTTSVRAPLRHVVGTDLNLSVCCERNADSRDVHRSRLWWWRNKPQAEAIRPELCQVPYGFPLPAPAGGESAADAIDDRVLHSLLSELTRLPWRAEWSDERAAVEMLESTPAGASSASR